MDVKKLPFAEWLEECIRTLAGAEPTVISIAAILKGGKVYTAYYRASIQDQLILAENIRLDATYEMIKANADTIVSAAEEIQEEEEDDDADAADHEEMV